jgi:hypothetical protein
MLFIYTLPLLRLVVAFASPHDEAESEGKIYRSRHTLLRATSMLGMHSCNMLLVPDAIRTKMVEREKEVGPRTFAFRGALSHWSRRAIEQLVHRVDSSGYVWPHQCCITAPQHPV